MKILLQPQKLLIVVILVGLFTITFAAPNKLASQQPPNNNFDVSYAIEPFYDINTFRLIVVMEFKGNKSGETKIILPNNYGSNEDIKGIKFLKPLSASTFIEDTDRPEIKTVKHSPNSLVRIYYQVEQIRMDDIALGNHYMATINKKYFHFLGETFFIVPDFDTTIDLVFKLYWNKLPHTWMLANSFGVNEKSQEVKLPIWKFKHSIFVGGDFRIEKRFVYNNPVYVALKGNWTFTDDQICDLVQNIIREERDFWNDFNFPFYLITVLPITGDNDQGGTGRINSYALFLSKDRKIDYRLKRLLAHETFHTWLGEKINLSEPEALLYWFSEGFCDYYARLLLLRSGLITFDDYVQEYNKVLAQYFTSPVRYETNERIAIDFWNDSEVNKLPYQRGDIIAHNLNSAILRNSNWKKSLDDLMRDIYKRTKNESLKISTGSLSNMIRFYGGEEVLADIMKVMNSGAKLKAYNDALGPCIMMQTDISRKFWLFGEKYEVPIYTPKNEDQILGKDCFDFLGLK